MPSRGQSNQNKCTETHHPPPKSSFSEIWQRNDDTCLKETQALWYKYFGLLTLLIILLMRHLFPRLSPGAHCSPQARACRIIFIGRQAFKTEKSMKGSMIQRKPIITFPPKSLNFGVTHILVKFLDYIWWPGAASRFLSAKAPDSRDPSWDWIFKKSVRNGIS